MDSWTPLITEPVSLASSHTTHVTNPSSPSTPCSQKTWEQLKQIIQIIKCNKARPLTGWESSYDINTILQYSQYLDLLFENIMFYYLRLSETCTLYVSHQANAVHSALCNPQKRQSKGGRLSIWTMRWLWNLCTNLHLLIWNQIAWEITALVTAVKTASSLTNSEHTVQSIRPTKPWPKHVKIS